jgi:hypothetical protein
MDIRSLHRFRMTNLNSIHKTWSKFNCLLTMLKLLLLRIQCLVTMSINANPIQVKQKIELTYLCVVYS